MARTSTASLREKKLQQQKITMLTSYDYFTAA
ncbi:MAG: 3-methyl-2-oxobutanoate hydroxymethyltransferase, partial [Syntrophomonadaceae bacterium]|nr:3-methyl-2-oxobutanoate hydroxymethyltransferase [Syntrophomonadaceae bacterium]